MKEPDIDTERLAALLASRLDEPTRAEVLAHLAASDDDYAVFADTAAVLRALEEEEDALPAGGQGEGGGGVPGVPEGTADVPRVPADPPAAPAGEPDAAVIPLRPPARPQGWRRPGARWAALAAALAAVALVPLAWWITRSPGPGDPNRLAMRLEARSLPPTWTDRYPWRVTRGAGDPLESEARAFRLGVFLVDLELAVPARDATATAVLGRRVVALLEDEPGGGLAAEPYREVAGRAGGPPAELEGFLEEGRNAINALVDPDLLGLGAWTEAARLAVRQQDTSFFRSRDSRAALRRAGRLPSLPDPARESVGRIRSALEAGDAPDWATLNRELPELLRILGQ